MPSSDESIVRRRIARRTKIKVAIVATLIAILVVYLLWDIIYHGPLMSLLSNQENLVKSVKSFGPFAPLLYIVFQIVQTVVAPIPGQITGSVGGFIFGTWGILWTIIGGMIGCWIVFILARKFGRPLLEKIFKKSVISKFDFILEAEGASLILFAIFLLPGFPDDIICYMAGLTKVPIPKLMIIVFLGRLPTVIVNNFLGAGINTNLPLVIGVCAVSVIILGLAVWQRDRLMHIFKYGFKKPPESDQDKTTS